MIPEYKPRPVVRDSGPARFVDGEVVQVSPLRIRVNGAVEPVDASGFATAVGETGLVMVQGTRFEWMGGRSSPTTITQEVSEAKQLSADASAAATSANAIIPLDLEAPLPTTRPAGAILRDGDVAHRMGPDDRIEVTWLRRGGAWIEATPGPYADASHKATHATGGSDALSPADIGAVPTGRTISAGSGLTGGGDLSANRTLAVDFGTTAGKVAEGNHGHTSSAISDFVEAAQDVVGAMVQAAGGTYDDTAGAITLPSGGSGSGIPPTLLDAKGDLIVASGNDVAARLPVGSAGQVLMVDAAEALGVKWATPSGGGGGTVLTAPDGGTWQLAVGNDGALSTSRLTFGMSYADLLTSLGAARYWDLAQTSGNFLPVIGSDTMTAGTMTRGTAGPLGIGDKTMAITAGTTSIPKAELGTTSWTYAVWVRGGGGTGYRSLIAGGASSRAWYLLNQNLYPYGFSWNGQQGPALSADRWYLMVIGSDATAGVKYWLDGVLVRSHATPVACTTNATVARIGTNESGSEAFVNSMAHPATWNRLLTDAEVAQLWDYVN